MNFQELKKVLKKCFFLCEFTLSFPARINFQQKIYENSNKIPWMLIFHQLSFDFSNLKFFNRSIFLKLQIVVFGALEKALVI